MAEAFITMTPSRMKLFKNSSVTVALAALSCLFASCANPVGTLVQDVVRAPFVALGAANCAVRTAPAAVVSTRQSLSATYNSLGPAAQKTISPNNNVANWAN